MPYAAGDCGCVHFVEGVDERVLGTSVGITTRMTARTAPSVAVWFLQGEQMIAVDRPGSTVEDAIRQLLAGPTTTEVASGVRTYVPARTALRSVSVEGGLATVDVGARFVQGNDAPSLLARLSQLVHTAAGPEGAKRVQLLVKGDSPPPGSFPGVVADTPLTVEVLQTPSVEDEGPPPQIEAPAPPSSGVRDAQQRLAALGYLLPGDVDGRFGPSTAAAVLAFQKWENLKRDGKLGPPTVKRLSTARRPTPITRGSSGRRAEVLLDRQVALAIENNRVVRTIHVSTGAARTPTPPGRFKVYAKIARWWSVPFREWLLWALPFHGGIALHQLADVPAYPASHGCVRERFVNSKWMYDFARVGMPVNVLARSR